MPQVGLQSLQDDAGDPLEITTFWCLTQVMQNDPMIGQLLNADMHTILNVISLSSQTVPQTCTTWLSCKRCTVLRCSETFVFRLFKEMYQAITHIVMLSLL